MEDRSPPWSLWESMSMPCKWHTDTWADSQAGPMTALGHAAPGPARAVDLCCRVLSRLTSLCFKQPALSARVSCRCGDRTGFIFLQGVLALFWRLPCIQTVPHSGGSSGRGRGWPGQQCQGGPIWGSPCRDSSNTSSGCCDLSTYCTLRVQSIVSVSPLKPQNQPLNSEYYETHFTLRARS